MTAAACPREALFSDALLLTLFGVGREKRKGVSNTGIHAARVALDSLIHSDMTDLLQVSISIIRKCRTRLGIKKHGIYAAPDMLGRPFNKAAEILTPE
jgi:hypothetical protein